MANVPDETRARIESDAYCETLGIDVTDLEAGSARTGADDYRGPAELPRDAPRWGHLLAG